MHECWSVSVVLKTKRMLELRKKERHDWISKDGLRKRLKICAGWS